MKKTRFLNIFGGPGSGKSTTALEVTARLKKQGASVEYVPEYAKDLVWEERTKTFRNQPYITAQQYHRLWRLAGAVDYVVTDSPLLMGSVYAALYSPELPWSFRQYVHDLHERILTPSTNIFLRRNVPFESEGRNQGEEEAQRIDEAVLAVLTLVAPGFLSLPTTAAADVIVARTNHDRRRAE